MQFNFTELLTPSVITLVGLLLFGLARSVAKKFLSKSEIETLLMVSAIAVEAAEQLAKIGKLPPEKRYRMAIDLIIKEMSDRGFNPSLELIASAIEAAVLMVNNSQIPTFEIEREGSEVEGEPLSG